MLLVEEKRGHFASERKKTQCSLVAILVKLYSHIEGGWGPGQKAATGLFDKTPAPYVWKIDMPKNNEII